MASSEKAWPELIAEQLAEKNLKEYTCHGMWTPSGYFHIGNARVEYFVPELVYEALVAKGLKAKLNFLADDSDPMDKIPNNLPIKEKDFEQYKGVPYYNIPSPFPEYTSWASCFTEKLFEAIEDFGAVPNRISCYESYKKGLYNEKIKTALDNAQKIVGLWNEITGTEKAPNFLPIQVVCENCGKLSFTEASNWDGKEVEYSCKRESGGCGHSAKAKPFDGRAKLHWRIHWPASWSVFNVAFESGGKDHFAKGGSVDTGKAISKEIFRKDAPLLYGAEFIQLRGAKMSGSVGNVIDLQEWPKVAKPEIFRFMNLSYRPNSAVEFSLNDNSFSLLIERYEQAERVYYGAEKLRDEKLTETAKKDYALSQMRKAQTEMPVQIPFALQTLVAQIAEPEKNIEKALEILSETKHISAEQAKAQKGEIRQQLLRAKYWLDNYAPEEMKIRFLEKAPKGIEQDGKTREVFSEIAGQLPNAKTPEEIQMLIYSSAKKHVLQPREIFRKLYLATIGKEQGPKFGSLAIAIGIDKIIKRLQEI